MTCPIFTTRCKPELALKAATWHVLPLVTPQVTPHVAPQVTLPVKVLTSKGKTLRDTLKPGDEKA